jgi:hypothetical protein
MPGFELLKQELQKLGFEKAGMLRNQLMFSGLIEGLLNGDPSKFLSSILAFGTLERWNEWNARDGC